MHTDEERSNFENAAYWEYVQNETDGRHKATMLAKAKGERPPHYKPIMSFANFTKRNAEATEVYLLAGLDAAWWGWKARANFREQVTDKMLSDRLAAHVENKA